MKVTLLNTNIHNDIPLYCTIERQWDVRLEEVLYVDTQAKESAFTAVYPSQDVLLNVQNFMRSHGLTVQQVHPDSVRQSRRVDDCLGFLPELARVTFNHENVIWHKELDLLYHLILSPVYVIQSDPLLQDRHFLSRLRENDILLNYWDTAYFAGERWSLIIPTGTQTRRFLSLLKSDRIRCSEAWEHDIVWNKIYNDLTAYAQRVCANMGMEPEEVEDALHDQISKLLDKSKQVASDAISGTPVNQEEWARWLGNFFKGIRWNLLNRARDASTQSQALADYGKHRGHMTNSQSPIDALTILEAKIVWDRFLNSLSEEQQILLRLKQEGMPVKEIAQTLGRKEGWVKVNTNRLKKQIRERCHANGWNAGDFAKALTASDFRIP